jgi:hypothetical protein
MVNPELMTDIACLELLIIDAPDRVALEEPTNSRSNHSCDFQGIETNQDSQP